MRQVELLRHVRLRILHQAGPLGLWCDCGLRRVERGARTNIFICYLPITRTGDACRWRRWRAHESASAAMDLKWSPSMMPAVPLVEALDQAELRHDAAVPAPACVC